MKPADPPRIVPFGDAAFLIELGDTVDVELNQRVHAVAASLGDRLDASAGWDRPVASYASFLLGYDPTRLGVTDARAAVESALAEALAAPVPAQQPRPTLEIPVRYGGTDGPDLPWVAEALGLSQTEVVDLHAGSTYRVFVLGFSPGFAYLGPLGERLRLPRRPEVRTDVPTGSVAIAGSQTAVYPSTGPGGWHLIGRTDSVLWDPRRDPPALLQPGDGVRFTPTGRP